MGWALWRKGKLGRPPMLTLSQPGWARAAPEPAEAGQQLYWALQHQLGYHSSALQHGLHGFCCLGIRALALSPYCLTHGVLLADCALAQESSRSLLSFEEQSGSLVKGSALSSAHAWAS